jgi:hypothetical protein
VTRAELACGRVGDDIDGMVAQPDRLALRLLSGPAACMTAGWCICMARGIVPPRVLVVVLAPWARTACHGPRTSWSRGRSCEAETCRVRWRLLVRGRDLLCKAETRRGDPSCGEPVGDVANWPETGRLASVGIDRGPRSSLS